MFGISARADLGEIRAGDVLAARLAEGGVTASVILVLLTPASAVAPWLTDALPAERQSGLLRERRLIVGLRRMRSTADVLADLPVVDLLDYPAGLARLAKLL